MEHIKKHPKIINLETYKKLFDDPDFEKANEKQFIIQEKYDGSQFSFGKISGVPFARSKNLDLDFHNLQRVEKQFKGACEYLQGINWDTVRDNVIFYCETLSSRRHNKLTYERCPANHLVLFGMYKILGKVAMWSFSQEDLAGYARFLGIDFAQSLPKAVLSDMHIESSSLGGTIEGYVIKFPEWIDNLNNPMMIKVVDPKFKEVKHTVINQSNSIDDLFAQYCTESRWEKALQHLRDDGNTHNDMTDVGRLCREVVADCLEEEKENIKDRLYQLFEKQLKKRLVKGIPDWYTVVLANREKENE